MEKLSRRGSIDMFAELCGRETDSSRSRRFARRFSSSEVVVERLDLHGRLQGHGGCVNTVEFNSAGDILVSGSDDERIIFWNWSAKRKTFSYDSGHRENIFQAKLMPHSDDRIIITSSADGEVRLAQILEGGHVDTKHIGKHDGAVHKLAIVPGSPNIFYSCGEDGFVQRFDLRSNTSKMLFSCSSLSEDHTRREDVVKLNTIVIDPRNPYQFAVGGSDGYARVYDLRRYQRGTPNKLPKPVDLFCPRHLIDIDDVHITGLAYSQSSELLVSYSDELIYLFQNNMGLGPSTSSLPSEQQEDPQIYTGHRNSHTVKGVSFFGSHDEYVASGSDCGHVFIWKKKGGRLVRLMHGDTHIVNQVEPHPHMPFLATCGIDDTVKVWLPQGNDNCPLPKNVEEIMETNKNEREDYFRITLSPDAVMHILRLQERQASIFSEKELERADVDFEHEAVEAYALGLLEEDPTQVEISTDSENPNNCCIC